MKSPDLRNFAPFKVVHRNTSVEEFSHLELEKKSTSALSIQIICSVQKA